jgi:CheY-like chemotaxis protein
MSPRPLLALADDDELHSEMLAAWLQRNGFDVVRFASGDALVSWAEAEGGAVDGIVLDVDMPGRDGITSYRHLRGIPIYAGTPAVFVTAEAGDALAERVAESGAHGMIAKDADLLPRLASWLSRTFGA